jgi:hypothetical protein
MSFQDLPFVPTIHRYDETWGLLHLVQYYNTSQEKL